MDLDALGDCGVAIRGRRVTKVMLATGTGRCRQDGSISATAREREDAAMRKTGICMVLLLVCGQAAADSTEDRDKPGIEINSECDVESDYDFALSERSVIFTRSSGTPKTVLMRQGRLFVDDRWVEVSAADTKRLLDYERDARAVMPLAQQIGREAAQIAFTAIGEVAAGFSSDPAGTRAKLAEARKRIDARIARSVTANHFSGEELGEGIAAAIGDVLPTVIGDIVGGAVSAAFGDGERLQRLSNLDAEIEALIEPRAKALEKNADALCRRMESLDRIENALDYRLPGGRALELLEVEPSARRND
jgi:hypothetical protein